MADQVENTYVINTEVRVAGTFLQAGVAYAPAAIKADIYKPGGTTPHETLTHPTDSSNYEWDNPSTGVYGITVLDPDTAGRWRVYIYDDTSGQKVKGKRTFRVKE